MSYDTEINFLKTINTYKIIWSTGKTKLAFYSFFRKGTESYSHEEEIREYVPKNVGVCANDYTNMLQS